MLTFFVDECGDDSSLIETEVEKINDAEEEISNDITDHEVSMYSVDDFIEDAIEDECITQEDIDMAMAELEEDFETECMEDCDEDLNAYSNEDNELINPFTEKITVEDYLNDI